jgi:hypothetical protein
MGVERRHEEACVFCARARAAHDTAHERRFQTRVEGGCNSPKSKW